MSAKTVKGKKISQIAELSILVKKKPVLWNVGSKNVPDNTNCIKKRENEPTKTRTKTTNTKKNLFQEFFLKEKLYLKRTSPN